MTLNLKYQIPLLLLALLAIAFIIYAPGLNGDFIFDDFPNIVNNEAVLLTEVNSAEVSRAFFSGVATSLSRPLSMMTFALNSYLTGLDPFYFKLTNLLIHLLICPGLYFLTKELLALGLTSFAAKTRQNQWLALLITAIWALHPLNVSTVLYVVQRMNQLSALVVIYTLLYYCRFRQRAECSNRQACVSLCVIGLAAIVGVLFKENAVLVVLYILAIEFFLLGFRRTCSGHRLFLTMFIWLFVMVPFVLLLIGLFAFPEAIIGNYDIRNFTLVERLLTEVRVIWMYAGWILMPDTRDFVFYYDDYAISHGLLDPVTTLASLAGLAGAIAFCFIYRRKLPILCFGIAFFIAGHAMESTVINLELVFEHRNYLPAYGLIFAGVYMLTHLPSQFLSQRPAAVFLGLFLIFLAHGTYVEARKWSDTHDHLQSMVQWNPDSHRANYSLGYFYNDLASKVPDNSSLFASASYYHHRAAALDPKAMRSHIGAIIADSQNNTPLDPVLVDELESRLRTLSLSYKNLREFSLLADCWYSGFCKFDKALLARFITAISRNDASNPAAIQATLAQLGIAVFSTFGNRDDGVAILYLARSKRKVLTLIDLQLIRIEIDRDNYSQARRLILESRQLEGSRDLHSEVETLASELDSIETSP